LYVFCPKRICGVPTFDGSYLPVCLAIRPVGGQDFDDIPVNSAWPSLLG